MFTPLKALITALFLATAIVGQTQQPALKPASPTRTPESTPTIKLEVRYNPEAPPAYLDVRGPSEDPTWVWVTRFVKAPGTRISADDLPVRAVKFETQFNGETTNVRVTVFRGKNGFEREDLIGLFKLGLGEHRLVSELQQYQVEPIDISISDAPSPVPLPPAYELRISAVEIVGTEAEGSPIPAYRIRFRNVTQKNISALQLYVVNGPSALLQGTEGRPLIEPKAVYEEYLSLPQAVGPVDRLDTGAVYTVIVASAVFDDGTYEGAVEPACSFESISAGRAFWFKTVLPVLDEQMTQDSSEAWVGAAKLKQRISDLKAEVPRPLLVKSSGVSPRCTPPGTRIEMSFNALRLRLMRELDQMISTRPAPPVDFKLWLRNTRNTYAGWLSRLPQQALK